MDKIDKRIIIELFKGNESLRHISEILNISPQAVHYRLNNLIKNGIFKGFRVYINPNVLGYLHSFIVIKGYDYGYELPYIISKFSCIEGFTIYEVIGRDEEELEKNKRRLLLLTRGEKYMEINVNNIVNNSLIDRKIIYYIKSNPKITLNELSLKLNLSRKKIANRLKKLYNNGLIKKIPLVDLQKANIIVFSVFSNSKINEFDDLKILEFSDSDKILIIGISENFLSLTRRIRNALEEDKNFIISIKYDYNIYEIN